MMYETIAVVSIIVLGVFLIFLFKDTILDFRDKLDWDEYKKRNKMMGKEAFPTTNKSKYVPWEEIKKKAKEAKRFREALRELERERRWKNATRHLQNQDEEMRRLDEEMRRDIWEEARKSVERWKKNDLVKTK